MNRGGRLLSPEQANQLADALMSQERARRGGRRASLRPRRGRRHRVPLGMLVGLYAGSVCGLWMGRYQSIMVFVGMLIGGVLGFFLGRHQKIVISAGSDSVDTRKDVHPGVG